MKVRVVNPTNDGTLETLYYDDVTVIEIKWVDEAGWYCYVINMKDGSTATFTCGQATVGYWNESAEMFIRV